LVSNEQANSKKSFRTGRQTCESVKCAPLHTNAIFQKKKKEFTFHGATLPIAAIVAFSWAKFLFLSTTAAQLHFKSAN
jgi:hypothetical protein